MTDVQQDEDIIEDDDDDSYVDRNELEITINTHPVELYDLQIGEFSIETQFDAVIEQIDSASMMQEWVRGKPKGEPYLDFEVKADLLQKLVFSMLDDLNAVVQFVVRDKMPAVFDPPNQYSTVINNAPLGKIFATYFFGVNYFRDMSHVYTNPTEHDKLIAIFDFLPPGMRDAMTSYLEAACLKEYGPLPQ